MTSAHLAASATVKNFKAGLLGLLDGLAGGGQADADIDARVLEIQRVGMALRAIADDGYFLFLDEREIGILIVISLRHFYSSCFRFYGE